MDFGLCVCVRFIVADFNNYTNRNCRHLIALHVISSLICVVEYFWIRFVNFTLESSMLAPENR